MMHRNLNHSWIYIIAFLLSTSFHACTNRKIQGHHNGTNVTYPESVVKIELDNAERHDKLFYSSFLQSPKTIILETNEKCLIKRIREVDIYKDKIYLLDDLFNRMYVFDMEGHFLSQIGDVGTGPGEYLQLSDFSIDRKENMIYLWDEAANAILKFELGGMQFVSSVKIGEVGTTSFCMQYFDGKFYLNNVILDNPSGKYQIKEMDASTGEKIEDYIPTWDYCLGWNLSLRLSHSFFYSRNSDTPLYIGLFSNTVFGLSKDGFIPTYVMESRDFATREDVERILEEYSKTDGLINLSSIWGKERIYQISRLVEMKDYLYFQYMKGVERNYALYDKRNGMLVSSPCMIDDYLGNRHLLLEFCFSDENMVCSVLNSEFIPSFLESLVYVDELNPQIDQFERLKLLNGDDNPVLFLHEYR